MSTQDRTPDEILASYSKVRLQCRVDRHRWGRKAFYEQMTPSFARRYQTCQDCGTQRWVEINIKTSVRTGRTGYLYASGYQTPRSGLTLNDFSERLYSEDYAAAVKDGRVEYVNEVVEENEPEVVTPIDKKAKKAS